MTCTTGDCFRLEIVRIKEMLAKDWQSATTTTIWYGQTYRLSYSLIVYRGRRCLAYVWEGSKAVYAAYYEEVPSAVGGSRRFWRCACGQRVTTLYLPRGNRIGGDEHFACRHCYRGGLPYRSQYENREDKFWRRCHELTAELTDPAISLRRLVEIDQVVRTIYSPGLQARTAATHEQLTRLRNRPTEERRRGRPSPKRERARLRALRTAERAAGPKRSPGRPVEKRPYVRKEPLQMSERVSDTQVYCPKCRDRRELIDGRPVTFQNGRSALQGRCETCGTTCARIVKKTA